MSSSFADWGHQVRAAIGALEELTGRVVFLHVRLKGLCKGSGYSYKKCTELLLDAFLAHCPKALLVPSFTYSFIKNKRYDVATSVSEVGCFSEEVRKHHACFRTPDPLFSVVDATSWLHSLCKTFVTIRPLVGGVFGRS